MTRRESKQAMLDELGAVPVVADALDPDQVAEAVARAKPEVIVHQLTAIGAIDLRHFDHDFAPTNRLRTRARTTCCLPDMRWGCGGLWRRATARSCTHEPVAR
jgi:hypothetical protein